MSCRMLTATMLVAGLVAPTTQSVAAELWFGHASIESKSAGCPSFLSLELRKPGRASFHPASIGANPAVTNLRVAFDDADFLVHSTNGPLVGTGSYSGTLVGGAGFATSYSGTFSNAAITPASVQPATKTLTVVARFTNYFGVSNCTVTIRAGLVKQIPGP